VDPARLVWRIAQARLSGTLTVEPEAGSYRYDVVIKEGLPRFVQSSRIEDRMLEMLKRQGQITADQAAECESEMVASGRRAGAVLLDRGWIKSSELIPTIRGHLENLLYAIFSLEEGRFRFDPRLPLQDEVVYLERRPAALVLEGVRRKYQLARLLRLVGGPTVAPNKRPDADEGRLAGADVSGRDWRIIDAMDGRHTIATVAKQLGASERDVLALAWALYCLELVSLPQPDEAQAAAGAAVGDEAVGDAAAGDPAATKRDFDVDTQRVLHRHGVVREGDYFACLGADPSATPHEIDQAYRQAFLQFSPENLHPRVVERYDAELGEIREVLREAHAVLMDDGLRSRYQRFLHSPQAEGDGG
jgi:hypothetical protein